MDSTTLTTATTTQLIKPSKTTLFLIDNDCQDININNINRLINYYFTETNHFILNGQLIDKKLFVNYLPIATSSNYLKLDELNWNDVASCLNVIFLTDKSKPTKQIKIVSLFYRILTGKSIILFQNDEWEYKLTLARFYPFFLHLFSVDECEQYKLPEITTIESIDQLKSFKQNLINQLDSLELLKQSPKTESIYDNNRIIYENYNSLFNYVLNNGKDWKSLISKEQFINKHEIYSIECVLTELEKNHENENEFKFYDAQYSFHKSLSNDLEVSLPKSNESTIYVYKANAVDFNFRNLKFKNVLIQMNDQSRFVLPFYTNEQATRQTIRFLIMFEYRVYNNSTLVDMILIYLFIKVSLLDDTLIRTKYENIVRLFLNRHGVKKDQLEFLKQNRKSILDLKQHFNELNNFNDENEYNDDDFYSLIDDFITNDFKLNTKYDFIKPFDIKYCDQMTNISLNENKLDCLPQTDQIKSQLNSIEINNENWPNNYNMKCDDSKLQLNSSLPFFICIKSYDEFKQRINNISWMKTISKLTDKLVLKGGAILDILCDRIPKDYDLMNIGMTNEELLDFIQKFNRELKPKSIEFYSFPISLFRITLDNGDLIELIINSDIKKDRLFCESYLPDQIAYFPRENKLYTNEYTLWALNYGYCRLNIDQKPKAMRLSKKLNKLGFNFYYSDEFKNKSPFLKKRLERYIWSICQLDNSRRPSYSTRKESEKKDEKNNEVNQVKIDKKTVYLGEKRMFANRESFLKFIQNELDKKQHDENDLKLINLNGAIILPESKVNSTKLSNGLDWSF